MPTAGIDRGVGAWHYAMPLGEAATYAGMNRESAMTYPLLRQSMTEGAVAVFTLGLVEKVAGIAAAAGGDFESAEKHFEAALGQAETPPVKIEAPKYAAGTRGCWANGVVPETQRNDARFSTKPKPAMRLSGC